MLVVKRDSVFVPVPSLIGLKGYDDGRLTAGVRGQGHTHTSAHSHSRTETYTHTDTYTHKHAKTFSLIPSAAVIWSSGNLMKLALPKHMCVCVWRGTI